MVESILISIIVFIFGACIGSFLNCSIYRMEQGKKITGRSFCPNCKHKLSWMDLLPIVSFVVLRRKCRHCGEKIAWQYLLAELTTGVIFVLIFIYNFSFAASCFLNLFFWFYIFSVLIIIFVYDLKHYLIPDKILIPAIAITFACRLFKFSLIGNYLLAALTASGFFFVIWFFSKGKWMGFGDVKLAILLGLIMGFKEVLLALFLAFFLGALVGLSLMVAKKKNIKSEIPFGPFLIVGAFLTFLFGQPIINWYFSFLSL